MSKQWFLSVTFFFLLLFSPPHGWSGDGWVDIAGMFDSRLLAVFVSVIVVVVVVGCFREHTT